MQSKANLKIAVTGTSGFIGSHLFPFLKANNHEVIDINLRNEWQSSTPRDIDAIIHLAGKAHDLKGQAKTNEFFEINVELTKKVFEFFIQSDASVMLHISSVAAIQEQTLSEILLETTKATPITPYGKSKLAAEEFLLSRTLPENKKVIILRPAMVHGEGDKGNLRLLYKIISKGIPYPLSAFSNRRSFLGIENFCQITKMILQNNSFRAGVYNLVDDDPISTNEIISIMGEKLGRKVRCFPVPKFLIYSFARLGDILKLPLNTSRLSKLTSNYMVSNEKIKKELNIKQFPITARQGISQTIESFTKQRS